MYTNVKFTAMQVTMYQRDVAGGSMESRGSNSDLGSEEASPRQLASRAIHALEHPMTPLEVPPLTLDALLRAICAELRLSDALHRQAKERYEAVGRWLLVESGPLARGEPHLFPQGSLRLLTTVRPRGT